MNSLRRMEPSINYYAKMHIPVQHGSMVNGAQGRAALIPAEPWACAAT